MKMTLAVDSVRRVVLPKPIRESLGIAGRSQILIEVFGGKAGCPRILILNPSHFRHVAPDLEIVPL